MRRLHWSIATFFCVMGCGSPAPAPEPTPAETTGTEVAEVPAEPVAEPVAEAAPLEPSPTCSEDSLPVVQSTLQSLSGSPYVVVDRATLPTVSPEAPSLGHVLHAPCPLLTVTAESVLFDGTPIDGADDAARARAISTRWRTASRARPRPEVLCVAAPADLPLARIEALVGRVQHVVLLAVHTEPPMPTRSPWLEETRPRIAALPPAERCEALRSALERATGSCEAARAPMRALVDTTPACDPSPAAVAGIQESLVVTEALTACHCAGADVTAIIGLYELAADRAGTTLRTFPLHGDIDPSGEPVVTSGPGPATVLELVRRSELQRPRQPQ